MLRNISLYYTWFRLKDCIELLENMDNKGILDMDKVGYIATFVWLLLLYVICQMDGEPLMGFILFCRFTIQGFCKRVKVKKL